VTVEGVSVQRIKSKDEQVVGRILHVERCCRAIQSADEEEVSGGLRELGTNIGYDAIWNCCERQVRKTETSDACYATKADYRAGWLSDLWCGFSMSLRKISSIALIRRKTSPIASLRRGAAFAETG
jgi:hypothetical protein